MVPSDLAQRLLRHVNRPEYQPVKPRVIAKQFKLDDQRTRELKREIKRLVKSGQLRYGANHLVMPAQGGESSSDVVGVFRRAMGGYGFVRPQGIPAGGRRDDDIFVAVSKTKDAANGDLVRVRTKPRRRRPDGRARVGGEIVEVIQRRTNQFVGTYTQRQGVGLVQIDGSEFPTPIVVGDPGAKRVHTGDKVVVEMVRYPTPKQHGEGVVTEVLGQRGQPGVDTLTVLREFALPEVFPEDVLEEARREAENFDGTIEDGRHDLTDLVVITIDPKDARDFDDAISLEVLENGHWKLGVHIADVSHFVRPRTALDREARDRATSVYLPDRVIPMLPEVVSNHLASLQPDQVRFVKSAFIEYTPDGARVATDFCTGAIKSCRRFTYEEVDQFLADRPTWRAKLGHDVYRLLDHMHRLAMILRKRRLEGGSIELNLPEIKIELDRDGKVAGAHHVEHTESHQVIEEFMLAANEAVAERLKDEELFCLRRIHESPDPTKIETLTEFVREIGISCESLEDRFEIKRVLHQIEHTPIEQAVNYAVLRAMRKAVYSPEDVGHYALAIQDYCHFTSPIRRYPDLTIHRLMEAIFRGEKPHPQFDHLVTLGDHCSQREQRAESAERELIKLKLLNFLVDKIGDSLDVVVTGVEEFGLFAQGVSLPAEGLIHVSDLSDDHYHFDAQTHALVGHREENIFRLGDLLRVEIAAVDLERRELDFVIQQRLKPGEVLGDAFDLHASSRKAPQKKTKSGKQGTSRKSNRSQGATAAGKAPGKRGAGGKQKHSAAKRSKKRGKKR